MQHDACRARRSPPPRSRAASLGTDEPHAGPAQTTARPQSGRISRLKQDTVSLTIIAISYITACLAHADGLDGWKQQAQAAAAVASALAMLAWCLLANGSYQTWRPWSVAAFRLAAAVNPAMELLARHLVYSLTPSSGVCGALVDACRIVLASRSYMLIVFTIFLPLDLPLHLAVQTLSAAYLMAPAASQAVCLAPFFNNKTLEERISAFHRVMGVGLLSMLPPSYPFGGRRPQCMAVLAFARIFAGWLLPNFLAARAQYRGASLRRLRQQWRAQQELEEQQQEQQQQQQGRPHPPGGSRGGGAAVPPCQLAFGDRLAGWIMTNVFLAGNPVQPWVVTWYWLATICWLAATVTSSSTSR